MLFLDVEKRLGDFRLAARFETEARVTALFGPSGAGKTTLINMIAGLLAPDRGRIMYRGKLLFDAAGKVNLPPHRRQFGYVFQDGRLFPHLTVRGNLEYGRRMYRLKRDASGPDRSRADFSWCMIAIDWGWGIEAAAARLMGLTAKARENGEGYARRTARAAADPALK